MTTGLNPAHAVSDKRTPSDIHQRAHFGLVALVALAPLPLGSARLWASSALGLALAALYALWLNGLRDGRAHLTMPQRVFAPAGWLYGAVVVWALVQTWALGSLGLGPDVWAETALALRPLEAGEVLARTLSVNADLTQQGVLHLILYAGVFVLAAQLGRDRVRARFGLVTLTWANVGYAVYGLAVHFSGQPTILGMEKWAYRNDVTATFVNHGAYAGYAGLGLVCALGLFAQGLSVSAREKGAIETAERAAVRAAPFLAASLVLASALVLAHARGGILATGVALALLLIGLGLAGVVKLNSLFAMIAAITLAGVFVLAVHGEGLYDRLTREGLSDDARANIYRLSAQAIAERPWTGYGLARSKTPSSPFVTKAYQGSR